MRHTGRGVKHIVVLSRFQFFTFKTLRARSTLEEWGYKACIASLSLSPLLSRSLSSPPFLPFAFSRRTRVRSSLSSSFVNDVTAFFLPRFQRVSTTMRVKSTRASIVTSRHRVFFSLSFFFFFFYNIIKAAQLYVRYADILHQAPYCLLSPLPPFPRNLISSRSTF